MMYDLEKANYDSKKSMFETKKKFDIGVVIVEGISGSIAAVTQGVKQFGPVAGGIIGGIEALAIGAATVASVAEIQSQTMDAPIPPTKSKGGGSGAGGGGMNGAALNPNKTAMRTSEENLNMMNNSSKSNQPTTVVKVTDINQVQNTVKVRENNSSY